MPEEGSGVGNELESTQAPLGTCVIENETRKEGLRGQATGCEHETGKGSCIGKKAKGITTTSSKEGKGRHGVQNEATEVMQWETGTLHKEGNTLNFRWCQPWKGFRILKPRRLRSMDLTQWSSVIRKTWAGLQSI